MSEQFRAGTVLGRYRLEERVGQGGMGIVVAAKHRSLDRRVAIKLLLGGSSAVARRRLVCEARAAQVLRSENVVAIHDVVDDEETPYIVMELLEGENLAELLARRGRLPVAEAIDIVLQAATGLAEAHAAGIVHRDVKPSNLLLARRPDGDPLVKLLDFGISMTHFPDDVEGEGAATRALLGSPVFMSPEQLRDPSRVDARTDVWSLAVTFFTLLTGTRPFEGRSIREVAAAIVAGAHPRLRALVPDAPEGLEQAIDAALAKRPEERTASVLAFARDIGPFASAASRPRLDRLARLERERDTGAVDERRSPDAEDAPSGMVPTLTDEPFTSSRDAPVERPTTRARLVRPAFAALFGLACAVAVLLIYELDEPRESSARSRSLVRHASSAGGPIGPRERRAGPGSVSVEPPAAAEPVAPSMAVPAAAGSAPPVAARRSTAPSDIDGIPIIE
jgi:serine/threonine protein kinase